MSEVSAARDDLMGRNEYARHRRCAPNAVKKAEDDGRIAGAVIREADGTFVGIDWRLADKLWAQNTDPGEAAKNGKLNLPAQDTLSVDPRREAGAPGSEEHPPASDELGPRVDAPGAKVGEEDPHGYLKARGDRERYQAERSRLDLLERLDILPSVAEVEDETFQAFRQLRDNLMLVGPRISQRLAAETDPLRIERLINEQLRTVLNELSRTFAADAADGPAGRSGPGAAGDSGGAGAGSGAPGIGMGRSQPEALVESLG